MGHKSHGTGTAITREVVGESLSENLSSLQQLAEREKLESPFIVGMRQRKANCVFRATCVGLVLQEVVDCAVGVWSGMEHGSVAKGADEVISVHGKFAVAVLHMSSCGLQARL